MHAQVSINRHLIRLSIRRAIFSQSLSMELIIWIHLVVRHGYLSTFEAIVQARVGSEPPGCCSHGVEFLSLQQVA